MALKESFLVEKRNILNEIRANSMSLQELRFFSIYLSKINSRDLNTRVVRFSLSDFRNIMEFSSHVKIDYIKHITNSLLCKVVNVPTENGGYEGFQLFMRCKVEPDENGDWYVEIDAHDQALPLMFQFKERYFTYELWNALRLKSSNQLRMYEILKQYENVGERVISVKELKELLGISQNEYPRYGDFKMCVLEVCQRALEESTDIKYTFEPTGKKGKSGKILHLKFIISKNTDYSDPISLNEFLASIENRAAADKEFMEAADKSALDDDESYFNSKLFPLLSDAFSREFSREEVQVLYDLAIKVKPYVPVQGGFYDYPLIIFDYLKLKYDELQLRASRRNLEPLKSRFGYLKKIIEADLSED